MCVDIALLFLMMFIDQVNEVNSWRIVFLTIVKKKRRPGSFSIKTWETVQPKIKNSVRI